MYVCYCNERQIREDTVGSQVLSFDVLTNFDKL
jgi:bacterioferritin-associated ferredoxin